MCPTPVLKIRNFLAQIFVTSTNYFCNDECFEIHFRIGKPSLDLFVIWVSYFVRLPLYYKSSVVSIKLYTWTCGNVVE